MLTWYSMYWCGSYKGSKWGVQTAPPGKHLEVLFKHPVLTVYSIHRDYKIIITILN